MGKKGKKRKSKALAKNIAIISMGIPPKAAAEKKELAVANDEDVKVADTGVISSHFERPLIPSDARKPLANRRNIVEVVNEEMNESLKVCLSECFEFDDRMIMNETYLSLFLRDTKGIDLSLSSDEALIRAAKQVFGDRVC